MNLKEKCIAVIGTGQIGCSIAMGLQGKVGLIAGVDTNKKNIAKAIQRGMIDVEMDIENAIAYANIIIVATPVDIAIPIINRVLDYINKGTVVIDVGSTKAPICKAVGHHINRQSFVASHPMAGSSEKGPDGANALLFANCKTFVCERKLSSKMALDTSAQIFDCLGSKVEYIDPMEHDRLVGLVSHLPHILSYSMCNVVRTASVNRVAWENIASTGFDSTSRLAKSPASMWLPIMSQNKDNLIRYINLMINELQKLEKNIDENNTNALMEFIDNAVDVRVHFEESRKF